MDPIHSIHYEKDTTFAILREAQKKEWDLFYAELKNLFFKDQRVNLSVNRIKVFEDPKNWFSLSNSEIKIFSDFNVVLMRKDPPYDLEYHYATQLLELGERLSNGKTKIINAPAALRSWNEKLSILNFPDCIAPTLVTKEPHLLKQFWIDQGQIVIKPLDGMGGHSVFYVAQADPNFNVIVETLTQNGCTTVMAQKYIEEIKKGDKRILMIDGEPVPYALARIPKAGEFRGNLAAGGQGVGVPLSARDYDICKQVGPVLKQQGLWFVGLDVIGDYLTEINVTSPTCLRELEKIYALPIARDFIEKIELSLGA